MSNVSDPERITQNRVVNLFTDKDKLGGFNLGYDYLGHWQDRSNNSNVETKILQAWLKKQGYTDELITKALYELNRENTLGDGNNLYTPNETIYSLLRYGVKVIASDKDHTQTVRLIDWENPLNNHFGVAEEVTVSGRHDKRPDIVLYVNGIALGIIELKRASKGVDQGIRQNLDNQKIEFIRPFFTTMQLVMAGNDSEGLRYGTIETPSKYYLTWKEENSDYDPDKDERNKQHLPMLNCAQAASPLDCALLRIAEKSRFLEIIHDFVVFDAGTKKLSRHNQYFGVKAAQQRIRERKGGIIWHTQGSGKSLSMVWLAKWIRETIDDSRVLIITDRTELDEQIEGVFKGVGESIHRCRSGRDMLSTLNQPVESLICSLVHKFGAGDEGSETQTNTFIKEMLKAIPNNFSAKGDLFVFVDECHRTQSGKLHSAMIKLLPNALFIGFTGTPLLKDDKQSSIETFGSYIHTYKFDQAVADGVVLDLCYEARDVNQYIGNEKKMDLLFDAKTKNLSRVAKARVKQRWSTMQKVFSSKSRLQEIVNDIVLDMETKPHLSDGRGNAMLVCDSVYQACKLYEMFSSTALAGKCAIITSYQPTVTHIKGESTGEGQTEALFKYDTYRKMLSEYFDLPEDQIISKTAEFEKKIKKQFKDQPAQMRLLIVVDKLLTGFDAPSATYLYIDKKMQDHGLFQAICRVNRLDGNDKDYGYIVDYKDLFDSIKGAMTDYTGGALDGYDEKDVEGLLKNRLTQGKIRLEETREAIKALCEPAALPRDINDYIHYFVTSNTLDTEQTEQNEAKRLALYRFSGAYFRAYAEISGELQDIGYSADEAEKIKAEVKHYHDAREAVKLSSGDYEGVKELEPVMRHIFDQHIRADGSEVLADFEETGLVELLVKSGITELERRLPESIRSNQESVAETIENNVRKTVSDARAVNPQYYDQLSGLLDELIKQRKQDVLEYQQYLEKLKELAEQAIKGNQKQRDYPEAFGNSNAMRNLYDNLGKDEKLVTDINAAVFTNKRHNWIGHRMKEKRVRRAIEQVVDDDSDKVDAIMSLVKKQYEYH